jgi:hypothetical protein
MFTIFFYATENADGWIESEFLLMFNVVSLFWSFVFTSIDYDEAEICAFDD